MTETPIEAAARAVRDVLAECAMLGPVELSEALVRAAVNVYLQACLADPATMKRGAKAIDPGAWDDEVCYATQRRIHSKMWFEAAIKALIDD